jgi:hypothetical protein
MLKKNMNYGSKGAVPVYVYIKSRFFSVFIRFSKQSGVDSNILRVTARLAVVMDMFRSIYLELICFLVP